MRLEPLQREYPVSIHRARADPISVLRELPGFKTYHWAL
jgi:hypothetical protein